MGVLSVEKANLLQQGLSPNFIGTWMMRPPVVCDELITYFDENHRIQRTGTTTDGVNLNAKKTTDISISPSDIKKTGNEVFERYFSHLFKCYESYLSEWPFLKEFATNLEIGPFALVKYEAGDHFQRIHTERSSLNTLHRVFVFMTYLNDVDDGGSTHFSHYDLDVQPQKGLTLIWPAEWTHAHRGNVVKSGSKYIISGWMHFPR